MSHPAMVRLIAAGPGPPGRLTMKRAFRFALCLLLSWSAFGQGARSDAFTVTATSAKRHYRLVTRAIGERLDQPSKLTTSGTWVNMADDCKGVAHDGVTD